MTEDTENSGQHEQMLDVADTLARELHHNFLELSDSLELNIYAQLACSLYPDYWYSTNQELKLELERAAKYSLIAAETFQEVKRQLEEG